MASIPPIATDNRMDSPGLRIGQVAESSGLPVKTIRFYCDQGLISPTNRSQGGYRLFDHSIYTELSLIRSLRAIDVPLSELRRLELAELLEQWQDCGGAKPSASP